MTTLLRIFPPEQRGQVMGLRQMSVPAGGVIAAGPAAAALPPRRPASWRSACPRVLVLVTGLSLRRRLRPRPAQPRTRPRSRWALPPGLPRLLRRRRRSTCRRSAACWPSPSAAAEDAGLSTTEAGHRASRCSTSAPAWPASCGAASPTASSGTRRVRTLIDVGARRHRRGARLPAAGARRADRRRRPRRWRWPSACSASTASSTSSPASSAARSARAPRSAWPRPSSSRSARSSARSTACWSRRPATTTCTLVVAGCMLAGAALARGLHGPVRSAHAALPDARHRAGPYDSARDVKTRERQRGRARHRLARLRRARRGAARRLRAVRRPGAAGRPRARARHQGQAPLRRRRRPSRRWSRAPTASTRPARTSARAAAAAGRTWTTRRSCAHKTLADRATRWSASATRRLRARSRSSPRSRTFGYRNKVEFTCYRGPGRAVARLPPRRPLGRGAAAAGLPAGQRRRQPRAPHGRGLGARHRGCEPFDQRTHEGYLRNLVVRALRPHRRAAAGARHGAGRAAAPATRLVEELAEAVPECVGLLHAESERLAEVTHRPADDACCPAATGTRRSCSACACKVSAGAFLQTNTAMCERLYELAIEEARLTGEEVVWDLYSGIGSIALALARRAGQVIGVEIVRGGVRARGRERGAQRRRERDLRRRATSPRPCGRCWRPACRTPDVVVRRPAARRPDAEGRAARAGARAAAHRLRLVQPDDARRQRRSCWTRAATAWSACGPSTCSRTRTTSSASRASRPSRARSR